MSCYDALLEVMGASTCALLAAPCTSAMFPNACTFRFSPRVRPSQTHGGVLQSAGRRRRWLASLRDFVHTRSDGAPVSSSASHMAHSASALEVPDRAATATRVDGRRAPIVD